MPVNFIRRNLIVFLCLITMIMLTACGSGGGYSHQTQWDYDTSRSLPAEAPPKPLEADIASAPVTAPAPKSQFSANLPAVKVAMLVPLSGKNAKLGQAMLNAAQIALFDAGHSNYKLMPIDTAGTAAGARQATEKAIKEEVELILGPIFAESVRAAKPVAASARISMISFSTDWTLAGGNTYIMGFVPFDQVERLTRYVASKNYKRIGVITSNDTYGSVVAGAYQRLAPRHGLQTITTQTFNPRSRNLNADIEQFSKYGQRDQTDIPPYDAVFMPVGGNTAITLSNLMTQYGLPPNQVKRLGTGLMDNTGLAREPGLQGTWFAAPSPNLRREFQSKYQATYGTLPPRLATLAYDATALSAVLAQRGLQHEGRPAFDKQSLTNPNGFFGIDGIFRFRKDGTAERGLAVLEFSNGNIRIIDEAPKTFQQYQY